eukprot:1140189-Pelagomonas_calceolata.AAC.2
MFVILQGLQLVNLTKPGRLPYFECQAPGFGASGESKSWEESHPWAVVIIVVVGCVLFITLLLSLYLWKGTEVVQKLNNLKKRMQGLPTSGPFTAVVTDIQGWTGETTLGLQHIVLSQDMMECKHALCTLLHLQQRSLDEYVLARNWVLGSWAKTAFFRDALDVQATCAA